MRQDQLAVHMVSLMDRQLKEAGLDLRLKVCVRQARVCRACSNSFTDREGPKFPAFFFLAGRERAPGAT